ncbi:MAG TPA: hypothetical protein VJY35_08935 [Candidatus Eisenbacteria bacterium]|nr:hypothetical protein [Candidatus Eisenbacteria bacterium]
MTDTFIHFLPGERSKSGKTQTWVAWSQGTDLGLVAWFGRWRCYAFWPRAGIVLDRQCLRQVANFLEAQTHLHQTTKRTSKDGPCPSNTSTPAS